MPTPFSGSKNHLFLLFTLFLALSASFLLFKPYIEPIIIAVIIGLVFHPIHSYIYKKVGLKENLASLISCFFITSLLLIPLFGILFIILKQGFIYTIAISEFSSNGGFENLENHKIFIYLKTSLGKFIDLSAIDFNFLQDNLLKSATSFSKILLNTSTQLIASVTQGAISFLLMLFILFFVFRDQEQMLSFIEKVVPLSKTQKDLLIKEVIDISKSALLGTLITAILQGIAGAFAMWLAGFPFFFWASIMGFASLLPVVGTALIWFPATLYLFFTGDTSWAWFLLIWSAVVVGSIDNFVRPLVMKGASSLNTLILFFAILGGLQLFGLIGVLYGPLIIAMTLVLIRFYQREFKDFLSLQNSK